jgi:hypothetical protein
MDGANVAEAGAQYKDRKGWLVANGILSILLGALVVAGCLAAVAFLKSPGYGFGSERSGFFAMFMGEMFAGMVGVGLLMAAGGVGSILAHRWARSMLVLVYAYWAFFQAFSLVDIVLTLASPYGERMSPLAHVLNVMIQAVLALVPVLLFRFYAGRNATATVRRRRPRPAWTDRYPLPVLGVLILCAATALGGVGVLLNPPAQVTFFGAVSLSPFAVTLIALCNIVGALAGLAYCLRLDQRGVWVSTSLALLWVLGMAANISVLGPRAAVQEFDLPAWLLDQLAKTPDPLLAMKLWLAVAEFALAYVAVGWLALRSLRRQAVQDVSGTPYAQETPR